MSVIAICNRALQMLNEDRINQIDPPEDTPASKACNLAYTITRDALLEEHPWNFAMTRASITKLSTAPAFEFDNQYQLPSDCLRVWELYVAGYKTLDPWVVEGRNLLTNLASPLALKYIQRVTDTSKMTPMFRELLSQRIAIAVGPSLRPGSRELRAIQEMHPTYMRQAKSRDAQEGGIEEMTSSTWEYERY